MPTVTELAAVCWHAGSALVKLGAALDGAAGAAARAGQVGDPRAVALNGPEPGQLRAQAGGQAKASGDAQTARMAAFQVLARVSVPGFPAPLTARGAATTTAAQEQLLAAVAKQMDKQAMAVAPPAQSWWTRARNRFLLQFLDGHPEAGLADGTFAVLSWIAGGALGKAAIGAATVTAGIGGTDMLVPGTHSTLTSPRRARCAGRSKRTRLPASGPNGGRTG